VLSTISSDPALPCSLADGRRNSLRRIRTRTEDPNPFRTPREFRRPLQRNALPGIRSHRLCPFSLAISLRTELTHLCFYQFSSISPPDICSPTRNDLVGVDTTRQMSNPPCKHDDTRVSRGPDSPEYSAKLHADIPWPLRNAVHGVEPRPSVIEPHQE
jgi:hypothetical protein